MEINGDDYTRETLYDMLAMAQSFLKKKEHSCKFFEDDVFYEKHIR